jgi:hypothetical protein
LLAFVGVLGLLMSVLGDHASMKRDIQIGGAPQYDDITCTVVSRK